MSAQSRCALQTPARLVVPLIHHRQHSGNGNGIALLPSLSVGHHAAADASALPFNLDPSTAKQMAALQATSLAKAANRSVPGGTSAPYFGGLSSNQHSRPDHPNSASDGHAFPDSQLPHNFMNVSPHLPARALRRLVTHLPPITQPNLTQPSTAPMAEVMRQRKRGFLNGLANVMMQRNTPLPPALTGVPLPATFDPAAIPWKSLEINPNDVGIIKLAGKDIDLYKLWAMVFQAGGGVKVRHILQFNTLLGPQMWVHQLSQRGAWGQVCHQFDLPETIAPSTASGEQPVAPVLERYYTAILGPFEEMYRKNAMEQAARASMAAQGRVPQAGPQQMGGQSGRAGSIMGMPGMNGMLGNNSAAMNMVPQMNPSPLPDNSLTGEYMPQPI